MLTLNKPTVETLIANAQGRSEEEVCGLVWRAKDREYVVPLENMARDKVKYYAVDPVELGKAYAAMDQRDGEPVAFYHSHPGGQPEPSEADMLGAMNVGMHYLILYPEVSTLTTERSPGTLRVVAWNISAWECIDAQVLVRAELMVR